MARMTAVSPRSSLPEKIATMNAVIEIQPPGLITLLLADKYAPFVPEEAENSAVTQKETTQ